MQCGRRCNVRLLPVFGSPAAFFIEHPMYRILRIVAALAATAAVSCALPATAAKFADPLDTPAMHSPLAARSLVNGLALAGQRAVAVGQRGHILFSDDLGGSWHQATVPLSSDLLAVYFIDHAEGWAVGHDGVILHSEDAGANWERQRDGRADPQSVDRPLLDVWFDEKGHGLAIGAFGLMLQSLDRGRNWHHAEDLSDNPKGLHLNAIRAVGADLYIVGEQGLVLKRAAGSERFTALALPYQGSFFGVVGGGQQVVAFGLRGTALHSADAGRSWNKIATGTQTGLAAGMVLPNDELLLLTQGGQLLRSRDRGASFTAVPHVAPGAAAAMLPVSRDRLLIGGPRGLRVLPLNLY
jgi:photosystem II stability/assembly factor-like uncharacterized protein